MGVNGAGVERVQRGRLSGGAGGGTGWLHWLLQLRCLRLHACAAAGGAARPARAGVASNNRAQESDGGIVRQGNLAALPLIVSVPGHAIYLLSRLLLLLLLLLSCLGGTLQQELAVPLMRLLRCSGIKVGLGRLQGRWR